MTDRLKTGPLVGEGAMARVFKGVLGGARGVKKDVAVKRLRPELASDPEMVELFVNEADIAVKLSHPNIIQGLELGRDDDGYFLLCEWLECISLADAREKSGPLPWPVALEVAGRVASALEYLHEWRDGDGAGPIVHRDVTPGNVFITRRGQVKLGDFGIATCIGGRRKSPAAAAGTPGFAAPEQSSSDCDCRADIFGLARTLACLCPPPESIQPVLERATADDPAQRFASVREFVDALVAADQDSDADPKAVLEEFIGQLDFPEPAPVPNLDAAVNSILGGAIPNSLGNTDGPEPTRPRRRSSPSIYRVLGIGLVAMTLLVVGTVLVVRPPPEEPENLHAEAPPPTPPVAPAPAGQEPIPEPAVRAPPPKPVVQQRSRPAPLPGGQVNLNAVPWAAVKVDGTARGNTPVRQLVLAAGRHRIELVHPPDGTSRRFDIVVRPSTHHTFVFNLRRGTVEERVSR